jgi:hypothetical protein
MGDVFPFIIVLGTQFLLFFIIFLIIYLGWKKSREFVQYKTMEDYL